ncbi:MAG: hypothetical protein PUA73_03995 [Bacilli bacterium]|nr:hypothetical protein [Bacilli bacterium]
MNEKKCVFNNYGELKKKLRKKIKKENIVMFKGLQGPKGDIGPAGPNESVFYLISYYLSGAFSNNATLAITKLQ